MDKFNIVDLTSVESKIREAEYTIVHEQDVYLIEALLNAKRVIEPLLPETVEATKAFDTIAKQLDAPVISAVCDKALEEVIRSLFDLSAHMSLIHGWLTEAATAVEDKLQAAKKELDYDEEKRFRETLIPLPEEEFIKEEPCE